MIPYLQNLYLRWKDPWTKAAMSFGFGIDDFITVISLANDIRNDFANAPSQFDEVSDAYAGPVVSLTLACPFAATHDSGVCPIVSFAFGLCLFISKAIIASL